MEGEDFDMKDYQNDCPPLFVPIAVPYEVLADSGIDLDGVVQFTATEGKLVMEQVDPQEASFACRGDCDVCPLLFHCSGKCEKCPCTNFCERCM